MPKASLRQLTDNLVTLNVVQFKKGLLKIDIQ